MKIETWNREKTWSVPLLYRRKGPDDYGFALGADGFFHLVFLKEGVQQVPGEAGQILVHAPAVLAINESARITLNSGESSFFETVSFGPGIINDRFSVASVRSPQKDESSIFNQDRYLLVHFLSPKPGTVCWLELSEAQSGHIAGLMNDIQHHLDERSDFWVCRARAGFLELLVALDRFGRLGQNSRFRDPIGEAYAFLQAHACGSIRLEQLAKRFHTNRTSLNEGLKRRYGGTVQNLVQKIRLELAAVLLRDTALSLSEVAGRSGFASENNFYRTFKNHHGTTPAQYRRSHSWLVGRREENPVK